MRDANGHMQRQIFNMQRQREGQIHNIQHQQARQDRILLALYDLLVWPCLAVLGLLGAILWAMAGKVQTLSAWTLSVWTFSVWTLCV